MCVYVCLCAVHIFSVCVSVYVGMCVCVPSCVCVCWYRCPPPQHRCPYAHAIINHARRGH